MGLFTDVKASGCTAHVVSSEHVTGKELEKLADIAALLRFPMPEDDGLEVDPDQLDTSTRNVDAQCWMCSTHGCDKSSWNRGPGEYCSKGCRDGHKQARKN